VIASKWGHESPALKSEGLAVFFQEYYFDPTNSSNTPLVRPANPPAIHLLVDRSFFLNPEIIDLNYYCAGCFTAFLIRRFGWNAYWKFYRKAWQKNFEKDFIKCFGISLQTAEEEWLKCTKPIELDSNTKVH
jgi:hypothetical protein